MQSHMVVNNEAINPFEKIKQQRIRRCVALLLSSWLILSNKLERDFPISMIDDLNL